MPWKCVDIRHKHYHPRSPIFFANDPLLLTAFDFLVVTIVILDGLIKPSTPGSLIEPAATYLFPKRWSTLPLSFGLLLSPWGGHSVFPNVSFLSLLAALKCLSLTDDNQRSTAT